MAECGQMLWLQLINLPVCSDQAPGTKTDTEVVFVSFFVEKMDTNAIWLYMTGQQICHWVVYSESYNCECS